MTTGTEEARIPLDPFVTDLEGESARLRAAGPLAAVELPGGVPVWAVTHHAEARTSALARSSPGVARFAATVSAMIPAGLRVVTTSSGGARVEKDLSNNTFSRRHG